jgi:hypothetical protein
MSELHFDFRDVFRAGRYGFSSKKLTVHFIGLALAYLIYEVIVYTSLLIVGGNAVEDFWNEYALIPVCPIVDYELKPVTVGAMGLGLLVFFVIFFSTSTMVSKITIQQLRGDSFFSMKEAASFLKDHWKAVFGAFVGLIIVFVLCMLVPIVVGLLGKIPWAGRVIVTFSSLLMPFAFFLGLLMVYLLVIFSVSLLFVPAVVAAADTDTFETIYQHFSIVWNQPWRIMVYEALLFGVKLICVPIWMISCLFSLSLVMLPLRYLLPTDMILFMGNANKWLGKLIDEISALPFLRNLGVFDTIAPSNVPAAQFSAFDSFFMTLTSVFMTLSLLFVMCLILAYLFSIASVGNTIIYAVLRRRSDGENLLEAEEEEDSFPDNEVSQEEEATAGQSETQSDA